MGDEESVAAAKPVQFWSAELAAAERVQRDELLIRRRARPYVRMDDGDGQTTVHHPSGELGDKLRHQALTWWTKPRSTGALLPNLTFCPVKC